MYIFWLNFTWTLCPKLASIHDHWPVAYLGQQQQKQMRTQETLSSARDYIIWYCLRQHCHSFQVYGNSVNALSLTSISPQNMVFARPCICILNSVESVDYGRSGGRGDITLQTAAARGQIFVHLNRSNCFDWMKTRSGKRFHVFWICWNCEKTDIIWHNFALGHNSAQSVKSVTKVRSCMHNEMKQTNMDCRASISTRFGFL